jgi:hypothetical protein
MNFTPEWHALGRESELAAEHLASGVTSLSKSGYSEKGRYTQAFFSLSIGLERIGKLAIIADYAIENAGKFPDNDVLKKTGHDIDVLLNHCEILSLKYSKGDKYAERPSSNIHQGIVQTLTEFAKLSRYYNLDSVTGGKAANWPEPISAWWERVGKPILNKHYTAKQKEKDEALANCCQQLFENNTRVHLYNEQNHKIDNIADLMLRSYTNRIVQKYGRFYTLQIIRWLSYLICHLSHIGAFENNIKSLSGLNERFHIFMNEDAYLKSRKAWSIYKP